MRPDESGVIERERFSSLFTLRGLVVCILWLTTRERDVTWGCESDREWGVKGENGRGLVRRKGRVKEKEVVGTEREEVSGSVGEMESVSGRDRKWECRWVNLWEIWRLTERVLGTDWNDGVNTKTAHLSIKDQLWWLRPQKIIIIEDDSTSCFYPYPNELARLKMARCTKCILHAAVANMIYFGII